MVIKVEDEVQISIRIAVPYVGSNSFIVILYPLEIYCGFPLRFPTVLIRDFSGGRRCLDGGGESFDEAREWRFMGLVK